ncbi:MAG: protein-tyrosine phosphatase [Thiomicrorhabdus sp.]|nr:MAG: protein-tyrosine phosphatase [Thiomicrorhabdus sp.]
MYDLHNHLLPGIDDGAPDLEVSIALAKMAVEDGITHMVCTPHIHIGRYENTFASIQAALTVFKSALAEHKIKLNVAAAAEIRLGSEIIQQVSNQQIPFVGLWQGKQVMLLEFPANAIPLGSDKLVKWLIAQNILPMIAHPERNQMLIENPNKLKPFLDLGCLIQVTAGSITGGFGQKAQKLAIQLLKEQKVTILATDAHNQNYRPPLFTGSLQAVAKIIDKAYIQELVLNNPAEISNSLFTQC